MRQCDASGNYPGYPGIFDESTRGPLKNWKILGGRCRAPLHKCKSIVAAVTALHFYKFNSPL